MTDKDKSELGNAKELLRKYERMLTTIAEAIFGSELSDMKHLGELYNAMLGQFVKDGSEMARGSALIERSMYTGLTFALSMDENAHSGVLFGAAAAFGRACAGVRLGSIILPEGTLSSEVNVVDDPATVPENARMLSPVEVAVIGGLIVIAMTVAHEEAKKEKEAEKGAAAE